MITPQQAAAMSPGQARKLCVALSASLSSMAAGMSRLGEENAGWLMAMRRAASVARTSGLPGFSEAGLPPFGHEQACRWLLGLVQKGLAPSPTPAPAGTCCSGGGAGIPSGWDRARPGGKAPPRRIRRLGSHRPASRNASR